MGITRRGIGVEVNKVHRQRQLVKRIHVRVEHLRPSKSRLGHLDRVKANEALKKAAKESGEPAPAELLKRAPRGPRDGFELDMSKTFGEKCILSLRYRMSSNPWSATSATSECSRLYRLARVSACIAVSCATALLLLGWAEAVQL